MYLRTCGGFKSAKKLWLTNPKSIKYKSANHKKLVLKSKILKVPHLRKSANITTYSSLQICAFAICGPPSLEIIHIEENLGTDTTIFLNVHFCQWLN
jgi:hypothetical protein